VGKSTLLYALIQRTYQSWADDAVAFQSDPQHTPSIRLPFQVRLLSNSIQYFNLETPQQRLLTHNAPLVLSIQSLAAVFILTRSPEYNGYSQGELVHLLRPDQAFTALLEHAYCFMPENAEIRQKMISDYLNLVGQIPVYRVTAPDGLNYFPNLLDAIENTLSTRS
jgi:hypothetical protein